jgi:transposase
VPPPAIRELRELTRYRKTQIDARVAEVLRLEKVLQDAGIKLTSVASKVMTHSGRAMIEALIAGERDPARLAGLAKTEPATLPVFRSTLSLRRRPDGLAVAQMPRSKLGDMPHCGGPATAGIGF